MATPPDFTTGAVLTASQMNAVGLWKVAEFSTTSGTAVTSPTVFSSDYDNYRIVITGMQSASPGGGYYLAMGSSSSGSQHYMGGFYVNTSTPSVTAIGRNNLGNWIIGTGDSGQKFSTAFDVCSPNLATRTNLPVVNMYSENAFIGVGAGLQNSTTQFTTFTLSSAGAAFSSGTVTVYGYKKG